MKSLHSMPMKNPQCAMLEKYSSKTQKKKHEAGETPAKKMQEKKKGMS